VVELGCGAAVEGDTRCGTNQLESWFYEDNGCALPADRHVGGRERVYRLELAPGEWTIAARLEPLDADLALVQLLTQRHRPEHVDRCDAAPEEGLTVERSVVHRIRDGVSWVAVEPVGRGGGRFRLSVMCWPSSFARPSPEWPPRLFRRGVGR
jgi:hypothetical protein